MASVTVLAARRACRAARRAPALRGVGPRRHAGDALNTRWKWKRAQAGGARRASARLGRLVGRARSRGRPSRPPRLRARRAEPRSAGSACRPEARALGVGAAVAWNARSRAAAAATRRTAGNRRRSCCTAKNTPSAPGRGRAPPPTRRPRGGRAPSGRRAGAFSVMSIDIGTAPGFVLTFPALRRSLRA